MNTYWFGWMLACAKLLVFIAWLARANLRSSVLLALRVLRAAAASSGEEYSTKQLEAKNIMLKDK